MRHANNDQSKGPWSDQGYLELGQRLGVGADEGSHDARLPVVEKRACRLFLCGTSRMIPIGLHWATRGLSPSECHCVLVALYGSNCRMEESVV